MMESQESFQRAIEQAPVATITDASGKSTSLTPAQLSEQGLNKMISATGPTKIYKTDSGWSKNAYDAPMSISLDEKTGAIKISAPKAITETEEFKRTFSQSLLQQASQAYKLNPDYKISVQETNESGEKEEKQISIPEYIRRVNEDLQSYASNLRAVGNAREQLVAKYGEKARNLTDSQMAIWMQKPTQGIYIPKSIFNVGSFGDDPSIGNPFRSLIGKGTEDRYSLEDLKEIYTRENFGRTELMGVLAYIDGILKGSDWATDEYYEDEEGNLISNQNSAEEMAKLLALREYIVSTHPEGKWYQQIGDSLESLLYNTGYYTTRVFENAINLAQMPFGEHSMQDEIKSQDKAMDYYNTASQLTIDSAQAMQILGMIGGTLLGSKGIGMVGEAAGVGISAIGSKAAGSMATKLGLSVENLTKAAKLAPGSAAAEALTAESMATIASNYNAISSGASLFIKTLSLADKVKTAGMIAKLYLDNHAGVNWAVSLLADTVHDALLYDSTTLRDVLEASDQQTRDYWLSQLADNAKWWTGMSIAKGSIKFAGKTTLGKAADALITPLVNRIAAKIGDANQGFKDMVAGGSVVKKLESQLENAKVGTQKYNRIARKLEIEEWNQITRAARKELGNLDLDWDGMKLTDESLRKFQDLKTTVKALENGIDAYNRNVGVKMDEMIRPQLDPATGKMGYINPTLAAANNNASKFYNKLIDLTKKYDLPLASKSLINQDVINYWAGKYELGLMNSFATKSTVNAAAAQNASEIISKNLEDLRKVLPEEITKTIDDGVNNKIYQAWYRSQNEYGMAKGLLNRDKVTGYESNPIWVENGYMPLVKQMDETGRWLEKTGRIDAVIEQDFEKLTFKVNPGQNYADPELVRQSRLKNMARAEINAQIYKSYSGFGSNATNVTKIGGADTEYVRKLNEHRDSVDRAIAEGVANQFKEGTVSIVGTRRRRPVKNVEVEAETASTITASMSPTQTADFLVQKKVLPNRSAKLTDGVTSENYDAWYNGLNDSSRRYLVQQYDETSEFNGAKRISNADEVLSDETLSKEMRQWTTFGLEQNKTKAAEIIMDDDNYRNAALNKMYDNYRKTNPDKPLSFDDFMESEVELVRWDDPNKKLPGEKFYSDVDEYVAFTYPDSPKAAELKSKYGGGSARETRITIKAKDAVGSFQVSDEAEVILSRSAIEGKRGFDKLQKAIQNGGDDFEAGLQRAYLAGDKNFLKSSVMNEIARNLADGKDAFYQGVLLAKIKGEMRNALKVDVDATVDSIFELVNTQVDNFVYSVQRNPGAKIAIDTLAETSNGADEVAKYLALKELAKKSNLDEAKAAMHKVLEPELDVLKKKLSLEDAELIYKKADEMLESVVRSELDDAASATRTINPDLVDTNDIYAKAKALNEDIKGAEARLTEDYIMYLDDEGRQVYAQVDPAFASLFNYRHSVEKAEASGLARINAAMSKAFRYGTTSVNLSSFGNQMFRDFGNALYVGGAWQTIKSNADNLVDVFGQDIVDQIKRFDPSGYEMKQLKSLAESTGQTVEEAAVSRELMKGSALAPSSTETTLYRKFMREAYGNETDGQLTQMRNKLTELADKIDPDKILNGKRENYLRRRVYASSLNDAMKAGYDLEQSRVFAEFAMNNATTNFGRQLYHMQAIADSTPYFRAAINGTKSFWRMWSLDPVGITGRIAGGLILPVMALTAYSLSSEENRKVYSNIPEYSKQNSLVFVFDGKPMSIPIPQEISNLVNPFRHFVEYLNDAQPNQFWELAMNDLLGFAPYDLQGFTAIDYDSMISDPTFFDRVSRGTSRVFSQMAPVPVKSAYMLATGIDPYSGKQLRSPQNNVIWNSETGDTEVMDYNQNAFARWFADTFRQTGISANLAEKVLSSLMGTTGSNLLGDMTALFSKGGEAFVESAATNIGGQLSKPFTVGEYDLATAVWKRAVNELTLEKEAILNSNEFKTISSQLSQTTDPEERKKLLAKQSNLIHEFQQKVGDMAKRLGSEYGGAMDRQKYAAVLNLLNFNADAIYQSGSQYTSDIASEAYYAGRNDAIHTMWELGIRGTEDASIFGYLAKDRETGETIVKYTSPIAIMDMKQQWYAQDNINAANISAALKTNNIKDAHNSITKQIQSIYNKGKLSKQDRANIEAIQINWNAQLAKAIAPYVAQMTPEAAVNNAEVMNVLYPYVEVPGSWEVNNRGKSVSLGERGNKKKAYYESWIKTMFSVNDPYKGQY